MANLGKRYPYSFLIVGLGLLLVIPMLACNFDFQFRPQKESVITNVTVEPPQERLEDSRPQVTITIPTAIPSPSPTFAIQLATATATRVVQASPTQSGPGFMGGDLPAGSPTAIVLQIEPTAEAMPGVISTQKTETVPLLLSPVTQITMARQLDNSQKAIEPTGVFEQTDTFFCSVEVANLEAGSQVTANWYRGDTLLDRFTLTTDTTGSGYLGFNLSAKTGIWPIGDYRVEIDLNGMKVQEEDFLVKPPGESIQSRVKSAILTKTVDADFKATEPSLIFGPTDIVHCSVNAALGLGAQLIAKWYEDGNLLEDYVTTVTAQENMADTYIDFYLSPSDPLRTGSYSVEILLNDQLARAIDFTVQGDIPANIPAAPLMISPVPLSPETPAALNISRPGIGPISFSTQVTVDNQPIAPATAFPTDTKIVLATFQYQGFTPGANFEQVWYLNGQETARGSYAWNDTETGRYKGSLNNEQGLLAGNYRLDISLAGELLGSGQFTIGESASGTGLPTGVPPTAIVLEPAMPSSQAASIGPINFSDEGLTAQQPIISRSSFPAGIQTVFATFSYSNFQTGDIFEQIWNLNGQESGRGSFAWTEAPTGQYQGSLHNDGGFIPGNYRLDIQLNGQLLGSGQFVIQQQTLPILTPESSATLPLAAPTRKAVTPKPSAPDHPFKIVYTVGEGDLHSIWTMNLDGTNRAMVTDHASDPSWAPDGNSIVFYGWDGHPRGANGIYQINADGTNVRQIWNQGSAQYLDWGTPGRYIAMNTIAAGSSNKRLVVYDSDEGSWRDIGPGEQPSLSPDSGQVIARTCIGSDCGLFSMGRYGENKTRLTSIADDAMPAWSPVGDRVVYSSQRNNNWDIWVMNPDGRDQTQLTQDPGIDAMPAWLPDGSGIVYRSTRDGVWGIWIMNADGSSPRKIIDAPASADWGRDRLDIY